MKLLCIGGVADGYMYELTHGNSLVVPDMSEKKCTYVGEDAEPKRATFNEFLYVKMTLQGQHKTFTFLKLESLTADEIIEKLITNYRPKGE